MSKKLDDIEFQLSIELGFIPDSWQDNIKYLIYRVKKLEDVLKLLNLPSGETNE